MLPFLQVSHFNVFKSRRLWLFKKLDWSTAAFFWWSMWRLISWKSENRSIWSVFCLQLATVWDPSCSDYLVRLFFLPWGLRVKTKAFNSLGLLIRAGSRWPTWKDVGIESSADTVSAVFWPQRKDLELYTWSSVYCLLVCEDQRDNKRY